MQSDVRQKFLNRIKGPVFPIPTPFTKIGDIDYQSLRNYVEFLLEEGAQTIMVTIGTSRFAVLTSEQMKEVNEIVSKTASGKALTIVSTAPMGPTSQAIEFARHAEASGADGILAVYPDRYYSDNDVHNFFLDITNACSIGVLIHQMPIPAGRDGLGSNVQYSPKLIERITAIENMVGMKEESHDAELAHTYNRLFKDKFCIIGGAGGMQAYMAAKSWGQPAYLVGIGSFIPQIEFEFYRAMEKGDYNTAKLIVSQKERPFFEIAVKAGWHLALKEALERFDLMPAWEKKPIQRLSRQMQNEIRKIVDKLYRTFGN